MGSHRRIVFFIVCISCVHRAILVFIVQFWFSSWETVGDVGFHRGEKLEFVFSSWDKVGNLVVIVFSTISSCQQIPMMTTFFPIFSHDDDGFSHLFP